MKSFDSKLLKVGATALMVLSIGSCLQQAPKTVGSPMAMPEEPETSGGSLSMRRLTEEQYRQSISDIFGADIKVHGRFPPEIRVNGLLALGTAQGGMTSAAYDQYDSAAREIAQQVLDANRRERTVPCHPAAQTGPDNICAEQFFARYGRRLFRQSVSSADLTIWIDGAAKATEISHDFFSGLEVALAGMLVSPQFLYRADVAEPDPDHPGHYRLTAFSMASRLSYLLWNSTPDEELLDAAQRGELHRSKGLERQVDRLLVSPRVEHGVRAFFSDFLGFEEFETLAKDALIYPNFNAETIADAQEQTLRVIVDHLLVRAQDYRDLFTTRRTFMTRTLGMIYHVGVRAEQGWEPYEFPLGDPRAGLLTQVSFTALHAHPGRSSATLRGKAIRELLLCQAVPAPPNNVDFTVVQDTSNPKFKTARDRLTAHRTNPVCAGCHKIMDPVGLGLENFDGAGQFRLKENDTPINVSGSLDGISFTDAAGVGAALHDSSAAPACLVDRVYAYAAGEKPKPSDKVWIEYLRQSFIADGYRFPRLLRRIATSHAFYEISAQPTTQASAEFK